MADQPYNSKAAGTETIQSQDVRARRSFPPQGEAIIHQVNWLGLKTLYMKEVRRFFKVQTQTIWAPAITTLLFLVIFSIAMGRGDRQVLGVNFATFVASSSWE
jgi:ABC-2 type transport system permease protein